MEGLGVRSPQTPLVLTTKGDMVVADGSPNGDPTRQAAGTNGQVGAADTTAVIGRSNQSIHYLKNHLANSAYDWWQIGTSLSVTPGSASGYCGLDCWFTSGTFMGGIGTIQFAQQAGANAGSLYGCQVKATVAGSAGGPSIAQLLSSKASLVFSGQVASASVLIKAIGNVNQVTLQLISATSENINLFSGFGSTSVVAVNSAGWTLVTLNNISVGTLSSGNTFGLIVSASGASSGHAYDLNNGFIVEQAQLNIGPVAMPFSRQYEDPAKEYQSVQYFFEMSYNAGFGAATATGAHAYATYANDAGGDAANIGVKFTTAKRTAPTIAIWDKLANSNKVTTYTGGNADTSNATGISVANIGFTGFSATSTLPSAAHGAYFHWTADARM